MTRRYQDPASRFSLGAGAGSYEDAVHFHARWNGFLAGYSDWFTRIDDTADFARAKAQKKVGVMLTFQDSTHFRSPDDVRTFFGLGQRISQLTYNFNNRIGSGFLEERDGGLSVFGLSIMERMQQVGMAVDVSHCGDQTTLDALDAAKKPVIFTHATARALVPGHLRCKTDEAIRKMAKSGGVMGIAMIRFMVRDSEPVTIEHVLDHVDYVARLVGVEHVGDRQRPGRGRQPERRQRRRLRSADAAELLALPVPRGRRRRDHHQGLNHSKRVFDLTEGLIRRGYTDAQIAQISAATRSACSARSGRPDRLFQIGRARAALRRPAAGDPRSTATAGPAARSPTGACRSSRAPCPAGAGVR